MRKSVAIPKISHKQKNVAVSSNVTLALKLQLQIFQIKHPK